MGLGAFWVNSFIYLLLLQLDVPRSSHSIVWPFGSVLSFPTSFYPTNGEAGCLAGDNKPLGKGVKVWCLFGFPGQVLVIGTATVSGLLLVEMHDERGGNYVPISFLLS